MRKSPRDRRLSSDFQSVQKLQRESSIFSFQAAGNPPQRYRLTFNGAGVQRDANGKIGLSNHHEVLVELGAAYPRMVPNLAWQTPVFHPNISNNGVVCLGGYGTHWVPSLTLSEMCTMLWDMIRYKNFDTESPYNREAALWAKSQNELVFPLDRRSIRDRISNEKPAEPVKKARIISPVSSNHQPPRPSPRPNPQLVDQAEIEIIETGIEIISSRDETPKLGDGGIIFLD
jgi:ubiquitin-protein ligase